MSLKLTIYERIITKLYFLYFRLFGAHLYRYKIHSFYNSYSVNVENIKKLEEKIKRYCYKFVPFYIETMSNDEMEFPIVQKMDYRAHGEIKFESKFVRHKPKYKMNTGGSTGEPFEFLVSKKAGLIDEIHQEFQHKKMGLTKSDKLFVFNGCKIDENKLKKNIFWNDKLNTDQLPFGSKEFSSHYLSLGTIELYLSELIKDTPDFVRSYPSVFCEFTNLLKKIGHESKPFILKGIQLTSEITTKEQEKLLKSYWGDILYFQYGHSEAATIASKYPSEDCYTFSPLYGKVEILDENNNHVLVGEIGRIIVTSFHNTARPFVRYDTGDLARFKENKNGVVRVYEIIGRKQDFVFDNNKNKVSITGLVFGQHFHAFNNIFSWQIINEFPGDLLVRIVKMDSFSFDDELEIRTKLSFSDRFKVEIEYVNKIEKSARGKHKLVICDILD